MPATTPPVNASDTRRVFGYFTLLILVVNLTSPQGSLASIPIQFYLKDQLHLSPAQQAQFQALTAIPLYGAFLFGLARDRLFAIGMRDRSYFLIFAPITALIYVGMSAAHSSYLQLLIGALAATLIYRTMAPAVQALQARVGQSLRMTGRMSVLVHIVGSVLAAALTRLSGVLHHNVTPQTIFLILAAGAGALFLIGRSEPKIVARSDELPEAPKRSFVSDLGKLLSHRSILPAVLVYLTWEFAPSTSTALLNHFTKTVGLSDDQYVTYRAIVSLSFIPGFLIYAWLCKRIHPRKLIFWSLAFGVPQAVPLTFVHSVIGANMAGVWYGMVGGMASAAVVDLLLRSCPLGFEGFTLELAATGAAISDRLGNMWGASLYEHGGFALTNWVTTAVYALMIPMLLLVPREVMTKRDSEEVSTE